MASFSSSSAGAAPPAAPSWHTGSSFSSSSSSSSAGAGGAAPPAAAAAAPPAAAAPAAASWNTGSCRNSEVIGQAEDIQRSTKESLERLQRQTLLTEEVGHETLATLREQRDQLTNIEAEGEHLNESLAKTKRLQNRFDRWALNWGGAKKRQAKLEADEVVATDRRERQRKQLEKKKSKRQDQMMAQKKEQSRSNNRTSTATALKKVAVPETHVYGAKSVLRNNKRQDNNNDDGFGSGSGSGSGNNNNDDEELSDDVRAGLDRLATNDDEIDDMLGEAEASLDRLTELSLSINRETQSHKKKIDAVQDNMDGAHHKQVEVTSRVKRNLVGRWARRSDKD